MLAALVSQTTGCIITSDDDPEDFATINADWSFHTVNPSGQLSPPNACPPGFDTVELHQQEIDASDRPIGQEIVDVFDCVDMRNFSDPLPPGVYETFISITSDVGGTIYADTLAAAVDVRTTDATFSADIVDNGGYFKVAWDLRRQGTNAALDCRDVAGLDGIEIASTLSGTTQAVTDIFDCEVGVDYSAPVMEGTYVIKMEALNTAGQAIGAGQTLNNKVMRNRNQVTDLGLVTLQIP